MGRELHRSSQLGLSAPESLHVQEAELTFTVGSFIPVVNTL